MSRKHLVPLLLVPLAIFSVVLYVFLMPDDSEPIRSSPKEPRLVARVGSRDGVPVKPDKHVRKNPAHARKIGTMRSQLVADDTAKEVNESEFSPAEQKIVDAMQDALDDDDFKRVSAQLNAAVASTNAAVRAKAVEALQWFGEKALPELTMFMADDDDDVRSGAIDAWLMGLSQMDGDSEKVKTVQMGLSVVTDKDKLEMMMGHVEDLSDAQKIGVLAATIEGRNKAAAEVARESYKFWTDEDYTTIDAANAWLQKQQAESGEDASSSPEN